MKIMLACCSGMSTSVVVQKMKDAAKEQGKDYEIWAVDLNKIAENVGIDALAYGRCNGAAILKQAEDLVNNG